MFGQCNLHEMLKHFNLNTHHGYLTSSTTIQDNYQVDSNDNEYIFKSNLAGIPKEHITVSIENNILLVAYLENNHTYKEGYSLPDNIETEKISAKKEDGMLIIILPKSEAKKKKEIKIS